MKELCIKLVTEICLHYDARSEKHEASFYVQHLRRNLFVSLYVKTTELFYPEDVGNRYLLIVGIHQPMCLLFIISPFS